MLTQERVMELFDIDSKGRLVRKSHVGMAKKGEFSTAKDKDGYLVVGIDKKMYRAHRIVWLYMHGSFPDNDIDHINRIKDDNRPENLRAVSHSENKQNQKKNKNNTSGFKGVWKHKTTGKFVACIEHEGKKYHIGVYETPEEAAISYSDKAAQLHKYNPAATKI